jgi:membrane fusion protein (multidrug efflux system)
MLRRHSKIHPAVPLIVHRRRVVRLFTIVTPALGVAALAGCFGKEEAPPPPPPEVLVATVVQQDVPVGFEAVGQTRGSEEVEIRARIEGYLQSTNFTEGQPVKRGDLLYVIDPRPFEAAMGEARGRLAEAQAALTKARNASPGSGRWWRSGHRPAGAGQRHRGRAERHGVRRGPRGAPSSRQVNLSYADHGPHRRRGRHLGHPVGTWGPQLQQPLTTVSQIDPIRVRVSLPERDYLELAREAAERRAAGDTTRRRPIEMVLVDGSVHPHPGRLRAVEARTDPTTGTMTFEVEFPNPDRIVRSGQFARIRTVREVLGPWSSRRAPSRNRRGCSAWPSWAPGTPCRCARSRSAPRARI